MSSIRKKSIIFVLCLLAVFTAVQIPAHAQAVNKTIYLTAATTTKVLIEPVKIEYSYTEGETKLQDVLEESGYEFEIAGGFVECIVDGQPRSYYAYIDNEEISYSLNMDPSQINVIGFSVSELGDNDEEIKASAAELSELVKSMADYNDSEIENIRNYPPAKAAYEDAKEALIMADKEEAEAAKVSLDKAVADYIAIRESVPFKVNVNAVKGEETVDSLKITFTDTSGNVIVSENRTSIEAVAGQYDYVIEDGGYNQIEGSIIVDGDEDLSVEFPETDWFADMKPLKKDKATPYGVEINKENHTAEFLIDDTADENSVYLRVDQSDISYGYEVNLRAYYKRVNGTEGYRDVSWDASGNKLTNMLKNGMEGNEVQLKATYSKDGYKQVQTYDVKVTRVPTLKTLQVREASEKGTAILKGYSPDVTSYDMNTVADKLYIEAESFSSEGYSVEGINNPVDAPKNKGESVSVTVKVSHTNGQSREYVLNVTKVDAATVTLNVPKDTDVELVNENGDVIVAEWGGKYKLIPGEKYTYTATKNSYFHTEASFEAKEGLTVDVVEPDAEDALTDFAFHDNYKYNDRIPYECQEGEFKPDVHEYTYIASDLYSSGAVQATATNGYEAKAIYLSQSHRSEANQGVYTEKAISNEVSDEKNGITLTNLLASCGYTQELTVRLSKKADGVTYYQDYDLTIKRSVHISSLTLSNGDKEVDLLDVNGDKTYFDDEVPDYFISLASGTEEITMNASFMNETSTTSVCGGYSAEIDGQVYESLKNVTLKITEDDMQTIKIIVKHKDENSVSGIFNLYVTLLDPVEVKFNTTPEDAIVFVKHKKTNKVLQQSGDNTYSMLPGNDYIYTVSCTGYKTIQVDYKSPDENGEVDVTLKAAPENNKIDGSITAEWPSFRQTADNNCVVDKKLPVTDEDTSLYWATKIGDGYGKEATGCPIIVDGYIYTYAGSTIYKVDSLDGKILAEGKMVAGSNFAINPPTYAEGMIFIGLSDGRVQAFNAKTLESLWVFQDENGGQPNCSITYKDGYIYTGFWKGENQDANYVCLSVTDEDPSKETEVKLPSWTYTGAGGFYWTGAYVTDEYLLIGTDDGKSGYLKGYGHVLSIDPKTGKIIDDLKLPNVGDVRCDMTMYEGKFYFTSKGGYFYELSVNENGDIQENSLRYIKLSNGKNDPNNPAMSTSTPTIYNGRAYIGTAGTGQFESYSGHGITVIDLTEWAIAYNVQTQGYPQTSGLLTTAYEEESGYVYVYFFDNDTPGKLRVIKDKAGQTRPAEAIEETYVVKGNEIIYETAPVLFTPAGEHAQYALCSPIVDEYGTIYFKNDSASLMALGSRIKEIKITKQPDKLDYYTGETFDPAGMEVTAVYANGLERDVTNYVSYSDEPLTVEDKDFSIRFNHMLYQNKDGEAGVECEELMDAVQLNISGMMKVEAAEPTCTEDGNIEYWLDAETNKKYSDEEGLNELTDEDIILPKGHKEVADSVVKATFSKDGKTAGSHCELCGEVIVAQKTIKKATVSLSKTSLTYNGKKQTPTVKVVSGTKTLSSKNDYSLSYSSGRKNVGKYTITIKLKGEQYSGTLKKTYKINPKATSIKSLSASKKAFTAKWGKVSAQASGYEIMCATNSGFTKGKKTVKVTSYKTVLKKVTSLKAKTKYYVKVRTYKTVSGTKYYSGWSKVKTVKTK